MNRERFVIVAACASLAAINIYLGWWISAIFCVLVAGYLWSRTPSQK